MTQIQELLAENERIVQRTRSQAQGNRPPNPNARRVRPGEVTNKDARNLLNLAIETGQVDYLGKSGSGHPLFRCPDGQVLRTAGSGSDRHQANQLRRDLRKHGVVFG